MPEHIRALIVIVFLGFIGFYLAKKIAPNEITDKNFKLLRNLWLATVLCGFLGYNLLGVIIILSFFISRISKSEPNKVAIFLMLAYALPLLKTNISGFGIINYLVIFLYPRFISLLILLPAAIAISKKNDVKFLSIWTDKFILLFALISTACILRGTTILDSLRFMFYGFTDIFLPYYVTSRGIKNLREMNHALFSAVTIGVVISLFAIFEYSKSWLLFNSLAPALGIYNELGGYMFREGGIRAPATLGHGLILGVFLGVTFNYNLYLANLAKNKFFKITVALILILGVFVTISRGPWIACVASYIIYIVLDKKPLKKLITFLIIATIAFLAISSTPKGAKLIKILPGMSKEDKQSGEQFNVKYREKLLENSIIVMNRNPFFGSSTYWGEPEMQELIQGEGIIDIVNSYLAVGLEFGYVGLITFVSAFLSVLYGIRLKMKRVKYKSNSLHTLGATLMSAILCYMINIVSCSTIGSMPFICWSLLGLGVAYRSVVNNYLLEQSNNITT